MLLMAKTHGIKYKSVSYVPGSQVRALAMLKGNIRATILDATNKNFLMKEGGSKFTVLPLGQVKASDEALFARMDWLQKNQQAASVFVEEIVRAAREINKDPASMVATRKQLGLLKDLPAKLEGDIVPYFKDGVADGIFPSDGGGENAAKNDLEFYALSGSIKKENPRIEDYWHLEPLKAALARLK
jgi:NitT/TauT family transport system substrate-binding protein